MSNSQQISKEAIALVRLYYGDGTKYLTISSGKLPPEWIEEDYRPLVLGSPVDSSSVDLFTYKFATSEIKLQVSNGDYNPNVKFSDLVTDLSLGAGNDIGFDNRACHIRKLVPGNTKWSECEVFRVGTIRDIAHTFDNVTFSIQDDRQVIHADIGTFLTDADAALPFLGLPETSFGKIGPLVYGAHQYYVGSLTPALATINRINTMPFAVDLGPGIQVRQWMLAKHKLNTIERVWAFEEATRRAVGLSATVNVSNNNTDGAVQSHIPWYDAVKASGLLAEDYYYPNGVESVSSVNWDNSGNAVDGDFDTFANADTVTIIGDLTATNTETFDFNEWDNPAPDANLFGMLVYARTKYSLDAGTITDVFTINGQSVKAFDETTIQGVDQPPNTRAGVAENIVTDYGVTVESGAATTVRIYEMYKRIQYLPLTALPLMTSCIGREYSATAGSHTAGDAILNPIGGIESLYLDELAANIDQTAFNTAESSRSGWVFAFRIDELTPSLPLIQEMGQSCATVVRLKSDNTVTVDAIASTYTSSDVTISWNDTIGPQFSRTNPSNLYTAVNVRYSYDNDKKFKSETGIAEDTAMQSKYNISQQDSLLIFESKFINDSATAILLRTFLLNQWKQLHNIVTFEIGSKYVDDLDIGKIIEFDNVPDNIKAFGLDITQNNTVAGQIIYKYWIITRMKKSINSATVEAFQLSDLS